MSAVIITGMKMPYVCDDCHLSAGYGCEVTGTILISENMKIGKPLNCPIKSVDGLVDYIKDHSYPIRYDTNSIEQGMTVTGIEQAIREYCEVE